MGTQSALVIFGGTGDLARRMLFPSLFFLDQEGHLADGLRIFGTGRSVFGPGEFEAVVEKSVRARAESSQIDEAVWRRFCARLVYQQLDSSNPDDFSALADQLGRDTDVTFFLSTSPNYYGAITTGLKAAGLAHARARIVLEKPIGRDLASSRAINDAVAQAFSEAQIFRIDHYLGKETVQNLLALRFANRLFEPLWNAQAIEYVEITIAETVGLEGRASYYDDYGAIRDMVQNHLMQLLCLIAMEPPASLNPDAVRDEKVKVLRCLRPINASNVLENTVRGQYRAGEINGRSIVAYRDEAQGFPAQAETFVALRAFVDNWRWVGVPFYLRTGKCMPTRRTQVTIQFRQLPHSIFPGSSAQANRLVIDIQPEERISMLLMNNAPGLGREGMALRPLPLNLSYDELFAKDRARRRIAYERLLLDAMEGRSTLFVRRDEIEAAWTWIDAIASGWSQRGMGPQPYRAGTWGPENPVLAHHWYND